MGRRKKSINEEELFWSLVNVQNGDECWEWTGYKINNKYGRFSYKGRKDGAHRIAWILTYGEIPDGLFVCHHCDNPPCCNPSHLFLGTFSDNMQDMWNKMRHPIPSGRPSETMLGEKNIKARLSSDDILQIRTLHENGASIKDLSTKYPDVESPAIWKVVHRINWKHI